MYDIVDLIIVALAGLFIGVFIMLVGFKLYIYMICTPPEYYERDEITDDGDWIKEEYRRES